MRRLLIASGICCAGALAVGVWLASRAASSSAGPAGGNAASTGANVAPTVIGTRVGNRAPAFTIRTVDGAVRSSEALRGQRALVVTSLATWCTSCLYEAEQLAQVYPEFRDRVEFLSVSIDPEEDRLAIEAFRVNLNTPWAYALASEPGTAALIRSYGLFRFDITYVIDRDGIVQYVDHGPTSPETLRRVLVAT